MGLDIYAGTLTRYYSHDWKTAVQQWAEKNGFKCEMVRPGGGAEDEEVMSKDEIRGAVEAWRDGLLGALERGGAPCEPWSEDDEKPYFTDKPDWDAYNALMLFEACTLLHRPLPEAFPRRAAYQDVIALNDEEEEKLRGLEIAGGVEWWLPIGEPFSFTGWLPTEDEKTISTAGALLSELEQLNEATWNADEEEILRWKDTEGAPAEVVISDDGKLVSTGEEIHDTYDPAAAESLAKFAFSIFYQAAKFSLKNRVPVLLDY